MTYFHEHQESLRYSAASAGDIGLRLPQSGAVHAVAAHFSLRTDPALVCMPTGSGKTVVLLMCPYVLASRRALIITPSTIVRGQIAENAQDASELSAIGVLPEGTPGPLVHEVKRRVSSVEEWDEFRAHDLVVATPHTLSPIYQSVVPPPSDLFDLILVDEAHHEAARGWRKLLDAFPDAKRVLFSATPFRRDRKEIRGRFVFDYPLRSAFEDGVFGPVHFVPAEEQYGADFDVRIAKTAWSRYRADRDNGLDHRIMVRTGSKTKARELVKLYSDHTDLRLQIITSDHSYSFAKRAIKRIKEDDLDGVVCVDMFGEGFNLPQLKVAALHSPHKSLAVTLQFIGRFARVRTDMGNASVVAVPEELGTGVAKLYREDATWPKLLIDFAGVAIGQEQNVRAGIATFEEPETTSPQLDNLSLYSLRPFCHSKIYKCGSAIDITAAFTLPAPYEIVFRQDSPELQLCVAIARKVYRPKWTDSDALTASEFELFACYFDVASNLLFICASKRSDSFYERIAEQLGDGNHSILSSERISRVLRDLQSPSFFHVGMKNSTASSSLESYVTKSGPRAHEAVSPQEGKLYHRGHIMAKGRKGNANVTLGYSSSSRVWSMQNPQLTEWRAWCQGLAADIASDRPVSTGTNLDILHTGQEVGAFPSDILGASWPDEAYRKSIMLRWEQNENGNATSVLLQDVSLDVDFVRTPPGSIPNRAWLIARYDRLTVTMSFSPGSKPMFRLEGEAPVGIQVEVGAETIEFADYLNNHPVCLMLGDCSFLEGQEFRARQADRRPIEMESMVAIDWEANGVDICREFADDKNPQPDDGAIHGYILGKLQEEHASVVVYDHGPGEIADLIGIWDHDGETLVRLYHCKSSGAARPGCRLADLYEVACQATKSIRWIHRPTELLEHLRRRSERRPHCFQVGRLRDLAELLQDNPKPVAYEIVLVQPGLSLGNLTEQAADVLAATNEFLWRDLGNRHLQILASE